MTYMKSLSLGRAEGISAAGGHDRSDDALGVFGLDGVEGAFAQRPIDSQARARAHLDVHV